MIASAILDRLLHHSITVNIREESYRLKEKLKAGLLKPKIASEGASAKEKTAMLYKPRSQVGMTLGSWGYPKTEAINPGGEF